MQLSFLVKRKKTVCSPNSKDQSLVCANVYLLEIALKKNFKSFAKVFLAYFY